MFPGILLCTLIFLIYPTRIDFRPMSEGTGFFRWVCRFLYANDRPMNVFPSLHCFEAIAVHLATFASGYGKAHRAFQIGSAVLVVLICLSTVFIKQHSVLDVLGGAAVAWHYARPGGLYFEEKGGRPMTIQPFNGAYFLLLLLIGLLTAAITHSFFRPPGGGPGAGHLYDFRLQYSLFFVLYKGLLSQDGDFLEVSHMEKFNWLNELPIQLCNINLFLIPIGLKRRDRALMGFSFFVAPLGALAAIPARNRPFPAIPCCSPASLAFTGPTPCSSSPAFLWRLWAFIGPKSGISRHLRRRFPSWACAFTSSISCSARALPSGQLFLHLSHGYCNPCTFSGS